MIGDDDINHYTLPWEQHGSKAGRLFHEFTSDTATRSSELPFCRADATGLASLTRKPLVTTV
jgi:hypothetical protein